MHRLVQCLNGASGVEAFAGIITVGKTTSNSLTSIQLVSAACGAETAHSAVSKIPPVTVQDTGKGCDTEDGFPIDCVSAAGVPESSAEAAMCPEQISNSTYTSYEPL
jgi:hypothetical protein